VAASLCLAWAVTLGAAGIRGDWNGRLNDLFFRLRYLLRGPESVLPSIEEVVLGDAEVQALGLRGGDRGIFARLLRVASSAGAAEVTFDIVFPEPGDAAGDKAFVREAAASGVVTLPAILPTAAREAPVAPSPAGTEALTLSTWHPAVLRRGSPPRALSATVSFDALSAAARAIAHMDSEPDPDGVYRRMPLLIGWGDGYIPALALRAAADALKVDPAVVQVAFGRWILLPKATMPDGTVRDIRIPIDDAGRMIIDFAGPWGQGFGLLSMSRLLAAETSPAAAEEAASVLDGAHLIVADLTTKAADYGPSPFEKDYPKSGLHVNVLNGILSARFLRAPGGGEVVVLNAALAALLAFLAWRLRPFAFSLLALLSWAALAAAEFARFALAGIMPTLAASTLGVVIVLVVVNAYRFFLAEREKMALRLRVERYFAPRLVAKILAVPGHLMSADQKVITVLFSDIAGFTAWSSTQAPGAIRSTLNEYFEVMTEIVFRQEGTVDKFIGDGLMAFFGDPLPQADHPLRAVRAAIEMQQAMRGLRERWQAEARAPLHIRIGINTGEAIVGDMGSRRIMAYTAIGANVNLGSRLEGKAAVDGVLVSAPVHHAVKDAVQTRFAGRITAKGISDDFETWEVIVP
jgi:adenylate cyclase